MRLTVPDEEFKAKGADHCIKIDKGDKPKFEKVLSWALGEMAYVKIDPDKGNENSNIKVIAQFGEPNDEQANFTLEDLQAKLDGLPGDFDD